MLIKPFVSRKEKVSVNSLPSINEHDSSKENHPAYFGTREEHNESLENEGRLLMLPIMYREWNLKENKKIHDSYCQVSWSICECQFAKNIRLEDLR